MNIKFSLSRLWVKTKTIRAENKKKKILKKKKIKLNYHPNKFEKQFTYKILTTSKQFFCIFLNYNRKGNNNFDQTKVI